MTSAAMRGLRIPIPASDAARNQLVNARRRRAGGRWKFLGGEAREVHEDVEELRVEIALGPVAALERLEHLRIGWPERRADELVLRAHAHEQRRRRHTELARDGRHGHPCAVREEHLTRGAHDLRIADLPMSRHERLRVLDDARLHAAKRPERKRDAEPFVRAGLTDLGGWVGIPRVGVASF